MVLKSSIKSNSTSSNRVIRPKNIRSYTGLSEVTIWRLEKAGKFPKRIKLSAGAVGWLVSDVEEWLESRQAA